MEGRYDSGSEGEFEPGSRGRVLRNLLGIKRVSEMQQAESEALDEVQLWAIETFDSNHRFTVDDIRRLHYRWLGRIYPWAGTYRTVNLSRSGFLFAAASRIPTLMEDFGQHALSAETPCARMRLERLSMSLARTHAELVLIHPFREGNGRCSRLLATLMAMQAGLPTLDFSGFAGRGKRRYIAAIHAALNRDYVPMQRCFTEAIERAARVFPQ